VATLQCFVAYGDNVVDGVVACILPQPAGDVWLREEYRTPSLKAKVILVLDARIQQI
jgi:hypothetical protein